MIVSTRDASASSWRPEKASTRELRSSIVTGASSSARDALATANRSPDGSPPIDSGSAAPDVALGEERAEQGGELGPGRAAARGRAGRPRTPRRPPRRASSMADRRADDQADGAPASDSVADESGAMPAA